MLLTTRNLTKHFGGVAAVQGLDFQVDALETRAVIGPNGAGKTTLLRLIMGELTPTRGEIFLNGQPIHHLPSHRIARLGIAKAFQIPQIFPSLTVAQNVQAGVGHGLASLWLNGGRQAQIRERVAQVLDQIHLADKADLPASELAHGEQKRLEIGLALAQSPQLLLLDEPTAGLSHAETDEIMQLIRSLQGKTTLVMVEHDMRVVMSLADTISVLHFGQLLAQGTPQEIRANPKVQEIYLSQHG